MEDIKSEKQLYEKDCLGRYKNIKITSSSVDKIGYANGRVFAGTEMHQFCGSNVKIARSKIYVKDLDKGQLFKFCPSCEEIIKIRDN